MRQIIVVSLIVVAAGAITAIGVSMQMDNAPDPFAPTALTPTGVPVTPGITPVTPVAAPGATPASAIPFTTDASLESPAPWQYDPVNNRHWHAEHGHWHPGPPPGAAATGAPLDPATIPSDRPSVNPNIPNPAPWQYDPVTNKHWHAEHGHWHDGPPPEGQ